jgi:hypothetical protein
MPVTLKNKKRQTRTFNLEAPFFVKRPDQTPYGKAESVTFLALEKKEGLPDAILSCAEVDAALKSGDLRLLSQTNPAPTPEPEPEPELEPDEDE